MTSAYITDSFRSIKRSISRFISIIAIVALGSGLFCGLNAVGPDMLETADEYYKEYNLMDLRLQSYLGLYEEDLEKVRGIEGVDSVMGVKFVDGYVQTQNENGEYEGIVDIDGSELTIRVTGLDLMSAVNFENGAADPNYINRLDIDLTTGRYPESPDECVVTCSGLTTPEQFQVGNTIRVTGDDEDIRYYLKHSELKIVGIVKTPYWVSYERGVTTAGSGKLGDFIYVNNDAFTDNITYYSEAYITLDGADQYDSYSDEYDTFVDTMRQRIAEAAEQFSAEARSRLIVGLPQKVAAAKQQIDKAEATVGVQLAEAKAQLDELREQEKTGAQQLAEAQRIMDEEYAKVQVQLQDGSNQYVSAVNEYNAKVTAVSQGQADLAIKQTEYNTKKAQADTAREQLDKAAVELAIAEKEIKYIETLIATTQDTLLAIKANQDVSQEDLDLDAIAERLQETNPELAQILLAASNLTGQGMAADAIVEIDQLLDQYQAELLIAKEQYAVSKAEYDKKNAECTAAEKQLDEAKVLLDAAEKQLKEAEKQLEEFKDKIQSSGNELQFSAIEAQNKYMVAQATLALKTTQYQNIQATIAMAEEKIKKAEAEVEEKIGVARTGYNKGVALIDNINDKVGWTVYTRHDNPGYTGYGQAAENMVRLAYIFPTFFFIVSTMVCLTTLTRMVEEERTQLGTLKALGYSNKMIAGKYILYSSLASSIGVVFGIIVGFSVMPRVLFAAWCIMYEMPPLIARFMPLYMILGIIIAMGTTILAAYLACRKELKDVPAVLMRPKPPKAGKRVFLEKVTFIWSRLSFTGKVTVRNLFRNKKRFAVTVLGIAGCTALLLAACGLRDAVSGVIDNQYGEGTGVAQYDLQVVLKDGQTSFADSSIVAEISQLDNVEASMLGWLKVCKGYSDRTDKEIEIDVLVPESPQMFSKFVNLVDGKSIVPLTDDGAVISKKLATKTETKIGDSIIVSWTEGARTVEHQVKVVGIVDNYAFHYVYMTPAYFQSVTGSTLEYNNLFCQIPSNIEQGAKLQLEKEVNDIEGVNGSVYTTVVIDNFNNIINTLNMVIIMFILAAMALAIVVLYNLNNINVNERIRELATLKVLGFYNGEVSAYIYRENIFLTLIGIVTGLLLGIPLNIAVVGIVDIDTLTFKTDLEPMSFVIAAVFTVLFAVIVNLIMHFKLKKISMVESLKSVE
ncbi:MAG: FtsX-like permease family protein [Clostridia bacterium]|nr:FtsX-like permease family protein [Clostridia bacterium]